MASYPEGAKTVNLARMAKGSLDPKAKMVKQSGARTGVLTSVASKVMLHTEGPEPKKTVSGDGGFHLAEERWHYLVRGGGGSAVAAVSLHDFLPLAGLFPSSAETVPTSKGDPDFPDPSYCPHHSNHRGE